MNDGIKMFRRENSHSVWNDIGLKGALGVVVAVVDKDISPQQSMKVVGAINNKIKNIVYKRYHWVIYGMFFRDELKPNFSSQSNSIGVCNTCLFMCVTNTSSSGKWNDGLNIQVFIFVTAYKGVLKNNSDDQFTFVVTMLGNSEEIKNFLVSSSNYKNQNLL